LFKSKSNKSQGLYDIKVFSIGGKLAFSKKAFLDKDFKLNIDVPTGTYYILLEGNEYFYSKIVKE
jgi:hypothetical protein